MFSCSSNHERLRILVLGGRDFLGPAIVRSGLEKGHHITLFNRGVTNPTMFAELPFIKGDREKGSQAYDILKKQQWDVVIDVWPEHSQLVDEATAALQDHAGHYVFISSVAVYNDFNEVGITEMSPLVPLVDDREAWQYPEEKAASETLVAKRFPENHTILRPGPIKGWRDPAYDLLYWLIKLQRNGSILAPGTGNDPLQFIDVTDVGRFAITAIEKKLVGAYNCVGPKMEALTWEVFLTSAKRHLNSDSELYWPGETFLKEHGVRAWDDLPLWVPISMDAFMQISNAKSLAAGFEYTPLEKSIDACLAWHAEKGDPKIVFGFGDEPVGLERTRELELIEALKKEKV